MRRALLVLGMGIGMLGLLPAASLAGEDGERWDHRHMRSSYRSLLERPTPAPQVRGLNRYEKLATQPAAAARTQVPETLEHATQRGWEPGGPKRVPRAESATRSRGLPSLSAGRHSSAPGSSRSSSASRSSALRSGSVRSRAGR